MPKSPETISVPLDSVEIRRAREREKAIRKYGENALAPGGKAEYDIADFAINELVGLRRYAEMLRHRFVKDPKMQKKVPRSVQRRIASLAFEMEAFSDQIGQELIECRQIMLEHQIPLGMTEDERFKEG